MATDTDTRTRRTPRGFQLWLLRSLTAGFGICSILWALSSLAFYDATALLTGIAQDILAGKSFGAATLEELKSKLVSMPTDQLRRGAVDVSVVRLRLLEVKLAETTIPVESPEVVNASAAVDVALSQDPCNSFLWFADYWLGRLRGDAIDRGSKLLRMSYDLGPNEAWIAQRRNPVALESWAALPTDLIERVLSEFARLVQSGLYEEAGNIVAGPGWPIHQQLLGRLEPLDEADRHAMARELARRDLGGVSVPGIPDKRPSRPF